MKKNLIFYTIDNLLSKNAIYSLIIGERSNGKTYQCLKLIIDNYLETNKQGCYLRRWGDDIKGENGRCIFDPFINNEFTGNYISKATKNKYDDFIFKSNAYYLIKRDKDGLIEKQDNNPFCYAYAIGGMEHQKGGSKLNINIILFDEFITRNRYLDDEFIKFQHCLSTIIRYRDDVKIFMCGNTIDKYGCPYFTEMGLTNIQNMKKNTIDVYSYGDSGLSVAVEYSDFPSKKKPSDKYFAFNNERLKIITNGNWEMNIYEHLPMKYAPKDVKLVYYIEFEREILQCNIIRKNHTEFTYVHRKTTPIQEDNTRLVYSFNTNVKKNYVSNIRNGTTQIQKIIFSFYVKRKLFYSSNDVGEVMRRYLLKCGIKMYE